MKKEWAIRCVFLLAGLLLGLLFWDKTEVVFSQDDPESEARSSSRGIVNSASAKDERTRRLRNAKPAQIPSFLRLSLEEADPIDQWKYMLQALGRVDESNWKEAYQQYVDVTRDTGRDQWQQWRIGLVRMGQVGREDAVMYFLKGPHADHNALDNIAFGWGQADPTGILKWLETTDTLTLSQHNIMKKSAIGGMTVSDPAAAIDMMKTMSKEDRQLYLDTVAGKLIQTGGITTGISWLGVMSERFRGEDDAFVDQVANRLMHTMFRSAAGRGGIHTLVQNLESVNYKYPLESKHLTSHIQQLHGSEPLDLLDELTRSAKLRNLRLDPLILSIALNRAGGAQSDTVIQWMEKDPDSPVAKAVQSINESE